MFSKIYEMLKKLFNEDANARSEGPQEKVSDDFIKRKKQSLSDSQGVDDFSGSSYKAPGNVDHEKTHSNMSQRNF